MMRGFFDPRQNAHAPAQELHNGGFVAYAETPARTAAIAAKLPGLEAPRDHGELPILAVHDAGYVEFLKTAPARWAAAGRPGDVMGYIWPIARRRPLALERIDALAGRYSLDASTPLTVAPMIEMILTRTTRIVSRPLNVAPTVVPSRNPSSA